jgi:7-keto-8-aminopelargonate synthetase-like enzyme
VFSAALPAILTVAASESISLLSTREGEEQISILIENTNILRSILDKSEFVETTSDHSSPITHYRLTETTISQYALNNLQDQERLLQDIVDEVCTLQEDSDGRQMITEYLSYDLIGSLPKKHLLLNLTCGYA